MLILLYIRYYVGYKLASSNKSFVFETVDISKESGKEHHLDIQNLKYVFLKTAKVSNS